ncbi:amidohydrolase family protein [Gordonia sp. NPDC058843]|uniref:amidohydrolase family protein n=1 Tax=Gordonia sp. NPDC058843 TaxID=3346648 RepID=UPI0036AB2531
MSDHSTEAALEPELPIVDCHHHVWRKFDADVTLGPDDDGADGEQGLPDYWVPTYLADVEASGHNITKSVVVECGTDYRTDGPLELRSTGEVEAFTAAALANTNASVHFGAGMISNADLRLGNAITEVLEAHKEAAQGRLRGIRTSTFFAEFPLFGHPPVEDRRGMLRNSGVVDAANRVGDAGLCLDVFVVDEQLPDLAYLANASENTTIVLNHMGVPLRFGSRLGQPDEGIAVWRDGLRAVARHPNVVTKIGGVGMDMVTDLTNSMNAPGHSMSSDELVDRWGAYVRETIDIFGVERCMFESNYPVDRPGGSMTAIWNSFKKLTVNHSAAERDALFRGNATAVYQLDR